MKAQRERLREGFILVPEKFGSPDIAWRPSLDYGAANSMPESAKWWLSCMGILRTLIVEDSVEQDDEQICRAIIDDWAQNNPRGASVLDRSWDGHAVALRSEVLTDLARLMRDPDYLDPILAAHRDFLAEEKNFQGNWNHGLDQAKALITLADYLGDPASKELGVQRMIGALDVIVDDEGATVEQSVHYQLYNYKQLIRAKDVLERFDFADKEKRLVTLSAKVELMKTFLAHATMPNANYVEIGDTPRQNAEPIEGSIAEYAATAGLEGERPKENVKLYKTGYVFGRTGWGSDRPFEDESFYALRFGGPRILHGHNDHGSLVYYSKGREILREGGFHGYTDDSVRQYLRLVEAHNMVSVNTPPLKYIGRQTDLVARDIHEDWQLFSILALHYDDVVHKRTVIFSNSPQAIVVVDELDAEFEVTATQRWHLGDSFTLEKGHANTVRTGDGTIVMRQHYPITSLQVFNKTDPDNPSLVAAGPMYETTKCPLVVTERKGRKISFLTTFEFGADETEWTVQDKRVSRYGVRRSLKMSDGTKTLEVLFLNGGDITVRMS